MSRQANVTKLTLRTIAALPLPPAGRKDHIIFDSELRGLGVRVTSAGGRSWLVQYRVDGRVRRYSLGRTTSVTPEQARRRAQIVLAAVAEGRDPYSEQRKAAISGRTLADVANEFVEKHAKPKQRTWRETERRFKVYVLPHWGGLPIGSVTRQAAVQLIDRVAEDNGPIMANRLLGTVRKLFAWAAARGVVQASPILGMEAPGEERHRDRVLSDIELASIWHGAAEMGWPWTDFLRVLILTGQRRSEVAGMRWHELDLVATTWTIPRERAKSDRAHIVHLSEQSLAVLESARGQSLTDSELVFTTTGRSPISGFSKMKRRLDRIVGFSDWRLHDLRRSLVSRLADMGVGPHVADKILNHAEGAISGVAAVYQRSEFLAERRNALDLWGAHIEAMTQPNATTKGAVVEFPTQGARGAPWKRN